MPNRAMAAKAERARRQRIEAGRMEYSKPYYLGYRDGNGMSKRDLLAIVETTGKHVPVKRCETGEASGLRDDVGRCGKGKRALTTRCYGDGRRRAMGLTPDMFTVDPELIRQ